MLETIRTICSVASFLVLLISVVLVYRIAKRGVKPPDVVFYGMDNLLTHLERDPKHIMNNVKRAEFRSEDFKEDDDDEDD